MCLPSTGDGFGAPVQLDEFTDQGGWAAERYYATIAIGGPVCVPQDEICNGKDDDCDGQIDGGVCTIDASPSTGGSSAMDAGLPTGGSGGSSPGTDPGKESAEGSCSCRAVGGRDKPSGIAGGVLAFVALALGRSSRTRRRRPS